MLLLRASPAPAAVPISSFSAAPAPAPAAYTSRIPTPSSFSTAARCSVGNLSPVRFEPLRADADADPAFLQAGEEEDQPQQRQEHGGDEDQADDQEGKKGGINVPRQRYIAVPKAALLDAALSLFPSPTAAEDFKRFARCLDAVLHAEHKETLEQMRAYYMLPDDDDEEKGPGQVSGGNQPSSATVNGRGSGLFGMSQDGDDDNNRMSFLSRSLDWKTLLGLSPDPAPISPTRVAFATHFQRAFMTLLRNAQFEELSAQDLLLTYSLNSDYLLTLPVYVDWKKAAESNAIIFRRGYSTESQKGLLLVEKLDYLQSKLLQKIFFSLSKPLGKLGKWTNEFMPGIEKINREPGISDLD
ncbi:hypothetical protein ACQJBY_061659 [Aegilops geniculata]